MPQNLLEPTTREPILRWMIGRRDAVAAERILSDEYEKPTSFPDKKRLRERHGGGQRLASLTND